MSPSDCSHIFAGRVCTRCGVRALPVSVEGPARPEAGPPIDPRSELGEWLLENVGLRITAHDDHWPGVWLCGRCPYQNVGPVCTKCGALCYEGQFVGGVAVG